MENLPDAVKFFRFGPDREVMRKLRSEEYGGKGKLETYHTEALAKNGERIPISLYASIIYEDDREVTSICGNLITNALNYTQDGGEIRARVEVVGISIRVSVIDNSFGIEPQHLGFLQRI